MVTQLSVGTLDELVEAVRASTTLSIVGSDSGRAFRRNVSAEAELRVGLEGIVSHDASDQVVTVWAGTPVSCLNDELKRAGQCVPFLGGPWSCEGTVGGRLSLNLPHSLEAGCGNWRDWVLGLTVVRPDGTAARAGSKAVKNVAGYDVHRFLVGARGSLGVIAQVILRTFPVSALPPPDLVRFSTEMPAKGVIQRVQMSDLESAKESFGASILACHPRTATIYAACESLESVRRFGHDWVLGWGMGDGNLLPLEPIAARYMGRARSIFDPNGKLNPGEWPL